MLSNSWNFFLDKSTTKFINTNAIQTLVIEIKKECEYKEDIMNDYYENETMIKTLERDSENLFNIETLYILSDLHMYRDDYFKVLADMENNIRHMISKIKKYALAKFSIKKTNFIIKYISNTL